MPPWSPQSEMPFPVIPTPNPADPKKFPMGGGGPKVTQLELPPTAPANASRFAPRACIGLNGIRQAQQKEEQDRADEMPPLRPGSQAAGSDERTRLGQG